MLVVSSAEAFGWLVCRLGRTMLCCSEQLGTSHSRSSYSSPAPFPAPSPSHAITGTVNFIARLHRAGCGTQCGCVVDFFFPSSSLFIYSIFLAKVVGAPYFYNFHLATVERRPQSHLSCKPRKMAKARGRVCRAQATVRPKLGAGRCLEHVRGALLRKDVQRRMGIKRQDSDEQTLASLRSSVSFLRHLPVSVKCTYVLAPLPC